MKCFQIVKTVLDDLYCNIPSTSDEEKDEQIRNELRQLSSYYQRGILENNYDGIDYSDPATRFAYVYTYVTAHANIVFELIQEYACLKSLFKRNNLTVSCIGGGPGSDILGILKFMERWQRLPSLHCSLYDREALWGEVWSDLSQKVDSTNLNLYFQSLDVTATKAIQYSKLFNAELFTMIYFMSEVYAKKDAAFPFFEKMFTKAKPGAIILFVDNGGSRFSSWFDQLASLYGFDCLEGETSCDYCIEISEEKTYLEPYFSKLDPWRPKLTANISYRICRKL